MTGVDHVLDVRGIMLLDHLDAGAAIARNRIDVGSLHQPQTDVGVSQAVGGARLAVAINLEVLALEQRIEQLDMIAREHLVGRLRQDRCR